MLGAPAHANKELGSYFPTLWQLPCTLWFLCFPAGPEALTLCCLLANWEILSPSLHVELLGKDRLLQHQTYPSVETARGSETRNYDKEIPLLSYMFKKKKRKTKKKGVISAFLHRRAKYGFSYQLHYFCSLIT